jgi:hypothetical protein
VSLHDKKKQKKGDDVTRFWYTLKNLDLGALFLSPLILRLTKVANSNWPFFSFCQPKLVIFGGILFFLTPHTCPGFTYLLTYLPTYLLVNYCLCTLTFSFPHLLNHLATHLPTFLSTYLSMYPCAKIFTKTMTMQVDEGIAIYQVGCFILLPTYLPTKPCNFMIVENNVVMTQLKVL